LQECGAGARRLMIASDLERRCHGSRCHLRRGGLGLEREDRDGANGKHRNQQLEAPME